MLSWGPKDGSTRDRPCNRKWPSTHSCRQTSSSINCTYVLFLLGSSTDCFKQQSLCYEVRFPLIFLISSDEFSKLLRWNPVTPLGIAHCLIEDDEYNGYQIPKGITVIPNVWAVLHDPETYPEPATFKLDRFLNIEGNVSAGITKYLMRFSALAGGKFILISGVSPYWFKWIGYALAGLSDWISSGLSRFRYWRRIT